MHKMGHFRGLPANPQGLAGRLNALRPSVGFSLGKRSPGP